MLRIHLLLITCCIVTFAAKLASEETPAGPIAHRQPGKLFAFGGGKIADSSLKTIIQEAGGQHCKILIIAQASAKEDSGQRNADWFGRLGATQVNILKLQPRELAVQAIESADLIWISGGSQNRLMQKLRDSKLLEPIRNRHAAGASIGGTSAGAAVMSSVMITGEAKTKSIEKAATKTNSGLGLWPGVIIDQHFHARRRFNRLLSAVMDQPQLIGIGIDEGTGVLFDGNKIRVIGKSSAIIIDLRNAVSFEPLSNGEGSIAASGAVGGRFHILRADMEFLLTPLK